MSFRVADAFVETLVSIKVNQAFAMNGGLSNHFDDATSVDSLLNVCNLYHEQSRVRDAYTSQVDKDVHELSKLFPNANKEEDEILWDLFAIFDYLNKLNIQTASELPPGLFMPHESDALSEI